MPGMTRGSPRPGRTRVRLVLGLMLLLAAATADARQVFSVNTGFTAPVSTVFEQVLHEVLARLGLTLEFHEISAERSLILVNDGVDDAECCRIPQVVEADYPGLITVPESVFEVRFSAFSKRRDIRLERWEDLRPYTVGTVTGWKILVNNIERVQPAGSFVLDDAEAMFRMLDMDRLDIATLGYLSGRKVIDELGLTDTLLPIEPPLARRELFLMVHPRHAELVPQLTETIREMKRDGTLDAIVRRVTARPGQTQAGRDGR